MPDRSLRADLADPVGDPMPDLCAAPDLRAILHVHLDDGPPGGRLELTHARPDARLVRWIRASGAAVDDRSEAGTRVVVGADGRMGRMLVRAVAGAEGCNLAAAI